MNSLFNVLLEALIPLTDSVNLNGSCGYDRFKAEARDRIMRRSSKILGLDK